jgi:tetratricopeptide (TPR) repeat protein
VAVAEICSALDGLPLSIELAAAQARMWPPRAILDRLQQRLGFLTDGARDLSDRQQSLRATLEWSEGLLDEPDRLHFAQLVVFAGSFEVEAAAAVTGQDSGGLRRSVTTFVEHSLIEIAAATADDGQRFRMLESIRHFALDRLQQRGALTEARRAHLRYFADLAGGLDTPGRGPYKSDELGLLRADDANVNAALTWLCTSDADEPSSVAGALPLASSVARLWHWRSTVYDGRTYLRTLLDAATRLGTVATEVQADAMLYSAVLAISSGDYSRATVLATASLELFDDLGDLSGMSWSHRYLAEAALATDDLHRSRACAQAQLDLARRAGDRVSEADAYNMLGQADGRLGAFDQAEAELPQSEAAFRELGNLDGAAMVLWTAWPSWPSDAGTSAWLPAGGPRGSNWTGGAETPEE